MPGWVWIIIAVSVIGEVVAVSVVLRRVRSQQGALAGLDFAAVRELSTQVEEQTLEHMRANWSGDPQQLSGALATLLPRVRDVVRRSGLPLDERGVRLVLTNVLSAHRIARRGDVLKALDGIASPEAQSAA